MSRSAVRQAQIALGVAPPPADPSLSADARRTAKNNALLAIGKHPATLRPLVSDDRTCGDCPHAHRYSHHARAYWKCDLHRLGESHSAASDIRKSWPACVLIDQETS